MGAMEIEEINLASVLVLILVFIEQGLAHQITDDMPATPLTRLWLHCLQVVARLAIAAVMLLIMVNLFGNPLLLNTY